MTARTIAGVPGSLLVTGMLLLGSGAAISGEADGERFLGFRLLQLDGAGARWGVHDHGVTTTGRMAPVAPRVTYAFASRTMVFPGARNCSGLVPLEPLAARSGLASEAVREEARAAFAMWQEAARIEFEEIADAGRADIIIGAQAEPTGHAFTNVTTKPGDGPVREIERSLICLNPGKPWKIGFDGNLAVYDLRYTIAHEIGHAIGLDHPDGRHALMSFRYQEGPRRLTGGDMEGAVALYGARGPSPIETGTIAATRERPKDNGDAGEPAPPSELAIGQSR